MVDSATNTGGSTINIANSITGIAFNPDGSKAYVLNSGDDNVWVINAATDIAVGSPIAVGDFSLSLALSPDGAKVYTSSLTNDNVSVINTATDTVSGTIPVGNS